MSFLWRLEITEKCWLLCITLLEEKEIFKNNRRQALNYGIVVGSFVVGAISLAVSMHFLHEWSIWIVSFNLFLIMSYYIARVKQLDLQDENI